MSILLLYIIDTSIHKFWCHYKLIYTNSWEYIDLVTVNKYLRMNGVGHMGQCNNFHRME